MAFIKRYALSRFIVGFCLHNLISTMNSNKFLFFVLILLLTACQQTPTEKAESSFDYKHVPYDLAALQRSYPDKTFDIKAYKNALTEAIQTHQTRSSTLPGFDANWTIQGPGSAGARINVIKVDPNNDDVVYIGYSGGGVWKTTDNGNTWNPIFDDLPYLAIGSIEIDPLDSDVVYVGTGDPNVTGYPYVGDGIYKSTDAGANWTNIGLQDMGIVSKIMLDPNNNQIIYASCMGTPFLKNNDRGLYKSIDGGNTWTQSLLISDQAGVIDFLIDPSNSDRLYACGWDRIRNNTESFVSGSGGRIFRSDDGGNSWNIMSNGLPTNISLSRSSITMSASNPNLLYASIIDSTFRVQGIYKTTNGGNSWTTVTAGESNGLSNPVSSFGWYFGRIFINPSNDNHVYLAGVRLWNSVSGGSGWNLATPNNGPTAPHVDNHYVAFNSVGDIYLATDGGLYRKSNAGGLWVDIEDIPTTQIYRVGYNPHEPDTYYGGAQDNGTQAGNANIIDNWDHVFGADGFQPVFNPDDDHNFYFETQRGDIWVTFDSSGFTAGTFGINTTDRVHWDMQYVMSYHNSDVLYAGTYRMYKTISGGIPAWTAISGDLTDGNIYGSPFHTISTVHESPVDSQYLYAGTTDGNVWRSLDAGDSWDDITAGLPDRYVTCVKAHPNEASGVFVAHSGYRQDENIPHLHYSNDHGNTWTNLTGDLPQLAINHIEVMPNNFGNVIFVATDGGVYATLNGGQNWDRLGGDFPYVPCYDLDLNVAKNELIVGTFGRAIQTFPLDSIGVSFMPPAVANVGGTINTFLGQGVDSVMMELEVSTTLNLQTDPTGQFLFNNVPVESTATLTPRKNIFTVNGCSTFDVLKIRTHILQIDTLDSPYKIIAADINKSKTVTGFDAVLLNKIVLFIDTFYTANESWRFVRSDHVIPNPLDPFTPDLPEDITYSPLSMNQLNANFIGIKVGDVTGNANPGLLVGGDDRDFKGELNLEIQDQKFEAGDRVEVPITSINFEQVLGYQFTLEFDTKKLDFDSCKQGILSETAGQLFGETFINEGILTTNWSHINPIDLETDEPLFTLNFIAKEDGLLSELIQFNQNYTTKEAYQHKEDFLDIELTFLDLETAQPDSESDGFFVLQNTPNPFSKEGTTIKFNLPKEQEVTLEIRSLNGQLLYQESKPYSKGISAIKVPAYIFPGKGIYLYQLSTGNKKVTSKMVRL